MGEGRGEVPASGVTVRVGLHKAPWPVPGSRLFESECSKPPRGGDAAGAWVGQTRHLTVAGPVARWVPSVETHTLSYPSGKGSVI